MYFSEAVHGDADIAHRTDVSVGAVAANPTDNARLYEEYHSQLEAPLDRRGASA